MTGGPGGPSEGPLRFGERMSGVEALMWRLGLHDARFRATMSLAVRLDGRLEPDGLRDRLSRLCTAVPRLQERVRQSSLATAPPRWVTDPFFSVDRHIEIWPGPLWDVAAEVVAQPFRDGSPPWRAVLTGDSPSALVLHLHHSYTDGLGGMRLVGELFDFSPGRLDRPLIRGDGGAPGATERLAPPRPASVLTDLEAELAHSLDVWSRLLPWAGRTLTSARHEPLAVLSAATGLVSALQTHAGGALGPASPLLRSRSAQVVLDSVDVDLDAMRRTGARLGATVNDVFLAGLLDGLERYHTKHGSRAPSLRLGMPISNRVSDAEMRNQVFGAVVRGPLGPLDFDERTRLVHEIVLQGRHQPWAGLMEDVAAGASRLPGAARLLAAVAGSLDVVASNVIGPPAPMWLAGVPVASMTPVGPRSGAAVNATLLSYCGSASIGLNIDPAAVPDGDVLMDCLRAAFEEGLAD